MTNIKPDREVHALRLHEQGGPEQLVDGGETDDALLIHLPANGSLFVGDVLMPQQ